MDAEIRVEGGDDVAELAALQKYLRAERELGGLVRPRTAPPKPGELGASLEVVTVALGSGGVGSILAKVLLEYVRNRRADIRLTVTRGSRKVILDARRVSDAKDLLDRVLVDDGDDN